PIGRKKSIMEVTEHLNTGGIRHMEARSVKILSHKDSRISLDIIPGHSVTSHSHINHYIDLSKIKHSHNSARLAAESLSASFIGRQPFDTIVCMEGTESVCAFIAAELADNRDKTPGQKDEISIVTPEYNAGSQMIFRD